MVVNLDEAKRCLSLARKKLGNGDIAAAERLAKKAVHMHSFPEAEAFLASLASNSNPASNPNSKSQPNPSEKPSDTLKKPSSSSSKPSTSTSTSTSAPASYTKEQVAAVKKIMGFKYDYYRVLELEKTASDSEIKKAYRKMALQFHPDKNKAPGADEAFKIVSQAFTVISDPQKRSHYDQFGVASTSSGAPSSSGFSNNSYSQRPFSFSQQADISPEDLFNAFFGQNMNGFDFDFGPGIRMRKFNQGSGFGPGSRNTGAQYYTHSNQNRNHQHGDGSNERNDGRSQLLSILIFFGFLLLSGLFTSILNSEDSLPHYTFARSGDYTSKRTTSQYKVNYFVNNREFRRFQAGKNPDFLKKLESRVVSSYVNVLSEECHRERLKKERMVDAASGWLGIGRDEAALKRAHKLKLPSCEELARFT